jgi:hypothetical protein
MIRKVCTLVLAAGFIFSGCSKGDKVDLPSGSFNGTVTASVDGGSELTVNTILAINNAGFNNAGEFDGNVIGNGVKSSNGSFTITLPTTVSDQYLTAITPFFDAIMAASDKGKLKVSNPNARIVNVDFIGFYVDENDNVSVLGIFSYATSDKTTTCMFVYVDSNVTITAGANVSISLKTGWNRIYISSDKLTTKAPDSLKWYFEYFN